MVALAVMDRVRKQPPRIKRLNLCLTEADYKKLVQIAEREDRDAGHVASSLVTWGIEQYEPFGSLVVMRKSKIVREKRIVKNARGRKNEH
jgi:hypothetical protein